MRTQSFAGLLLMALAGCGAEKEAPIPPEHARAFAVCQGMMRERYEEWRKVHRREMSPAEFARRTTFGELGSEGTAVRSLGGGVFEVQGWAERPNQTRQGEGSFRGHFACTLRESWTEAAPIQVIG
jgi:hypothetical protein